MALATGAKLAAADRTNTLWQRDLSFGHESVGDVLRAQGDLAGALVEYRAALVIAEALAAADPANVELRASRDALASTAATCCR